MIYLTAAQTKALESLQQRAMKIIFPDNDYLTSLIFASVDTLGDEAEAKREINIQFLTCFCRKFRM